MQATTIWAYVLRPGVRVCPWQQHPKTGKQSHQTRTQDHHTQHIKMCQNAQTHGEHSWVPIYEDGGYSGARTGAGGYTIHLGQGKEAKRAADDCWQSCAHTHTTKRNNKTQDLARRCTDDSWSYGCVFDMFLGLKGPVKLGNRHKDKSREGANQNNHS